MANEIERKFLVNDEFRHFSTAETRIVQGYLSSVPERTVRIRIKGDKGFITIKGIGNESGATRYRFHPTLLPKAPLEWVGKVSPFVRRPS